MRLKNVRHAVSLLADSTNRGNLNGPTSPSQGWPGRPIHLLLLGLRRALPRQYGALGGVLPGLAEPVALALDRDHVGVMDHPVDERGGARRVGEDGRPVDKGEIGGEHEAFLLVPAADHLEEEVGVPVVEGEMSYLVEHEEADL